MRKFAIEAKEMIRALAARTLGFRIQPIAAIDQALLPLRRGPSYQTFAAGAKSKRRRIGGVRTELTFAAGIPVSALAQMAGEALNIGPKVSWSLPDQKVAFASRHRLINQERKLSRCQFLLQE